MKWQIKTRKQNWKTKRIKLPRMKWKLKTKQQNWKTNRIKLPRMKWKLKTIHQNWMFYPEEKKKWNDKRN